MNKLNPIHVLLVEDNPADADLAKETLESGKLVLELSVVSDGLEAVQFIRQQGQYSSAPKLDLILLDLNLPKKDGREVLADIKEDATLRRIPIVILTSSDAEKDIVQSYNLGANCYLTKPMDLTAFRAVVQAVENFWFTIVKLPPMRG
jgi:two-component system response regulator